MTTTTQWGWKNVETGTICQNVIQDTPAALYEYSGLSVPEDPTQPRNGFQAVPVRLVRWEDKEYAVTKTRKHKFKQMVIEEVSDDEEQKNA